MLDMVKSCCKCVCQGARCVSVDAAALRLQGGISNGCTSVCKWGSDSQS
jgi:hypothetical protein